MSKKQTAVEWLAEKIYLEGLDDEFVTQAKKMEKEQINNAHYEGYMDGTAKKVIWDDKYYIETYGGAK